MSLPSFNTDAQKISACQCATRPVANLSNSRGTQNMQAEYNVRFWILERPFFEHQFGAALFARGRAFFGGLENKLDGSGKLIFHARENLRYAHKDRNVVVVTARMHHSDFLAVVIGFHFRSERQIDLLCNWQGIHIGAKCYHLARLGPSQDSNYAGVSDACFDFNFETPQVFRNQRGGTCLAITQLRMLMDITPPGDDLAFDLFGTSVDFAGCWRRCLGKQEENK